MKLAYNQIKQQYDMYEGAYRYLEDWYGHRALHVP